MFKRSLEMRSIKIRFHLVAIGFLFTLFLSLSARLFGDDPGSAARCVPACPVPRVASRLRVNVAGALPYEESGATRDLDGGLPVVLVVGLLLIHAI